MHFIGMQAVHFEHVEMCYNIWQTLFSLVFAVVSVWAGIKVARYDMFAGPDRVEKLKGLIQNHPAVTSKMNRAAASRHIHMVALFWNLHWIVAGSLLAACGALSMHYFGMYAMKGPFRKVWNWPILGASILVGMVVCLAGFWILFRPLHWKVEKSWYRYVSAGLIALAVCGLHFLGMLSVTYIYDIEQYVGYCTGDKLFGWEPTQLFVLGVGIAVPLVAFVVEHTISNELRRTYRQLLDIKLSPSEMERLSSSLADIKKSRVNGSRVSVTGLSPHQSSQFHRHSSFQANSGAMSNDSDRSCYGRATSSAVMGDDAIQSHTHIPSTTFTIDDSAQSSFHRAPAPATVITDDSTGQEQSDEQPPQRQRRESYRRQNLNIITEEKSDVELGASGADLMHHETMSSYCDLCSSCDLGSSAAEENDSDDVPKEFQEEEQQEEAKEEKQEAEEPEKSNIFRFLMSLKEEVRSPRDPGVKTVAEKAAAAAGAGRGQKDRRRRSSGAIPSFGVVADDLSSIGGDDLLCESTRIQEEFQSSHVSLDICVETWTAPSADKFEDEEMGCRNKNTFSAQSPPSQGRHIRSTAA